VDLVPVDLVPVDLVPVDLVPVDLVPVDLVPVHLVPVYLVPVLVQLMVPEAAQDTPGRVVFQSRPFCCSWGRDLSGWLGWEGS
jgi:hypothetical protein